MQDHCYQPPFTKCGGIQKSMGHKVPWKTGMLICHPVTSRPRAFLQKKSVLSHCNFATTHLAACILNFYLPVTSRPMNWRTLSQRPNSASPKVSHKTVFILMFRQPGSANTGFCSTLAISTYSFSPLNSTNTLLCNTLALSHQPYV